MRTTMTVLEAFRASADADVYILLGDGVGEAFITGGMRHSGGVALTVNPGTGGSMRVDLKEDEEYVVRIYN